MAEIQKTVQTSLTGKAGALRVEAARWFRAGRERVRSEGAARTVRAGVSLAAAHATYPIVAARQKKRTFPFDGQSLTYDVSRWNNAWLNERSVEVAIARAVLEARTGSMLEIGNVLSHYGWSGQVVLDLYEGLPGVINEDVRTWRSDRRFDTIASISTLEHVGWDEAIEDPAGAAVAVANLRAHLAPGGLLLVTVPLGYNPHLDAAVKSGALRFDDMTFLERTSRRNEWAPCSKEVGLARAYGGRFRNGNGLLIGVDRRSE